MRDKEGTKMFEITASGRLGEDPREDARMHIDGGHVPVVCAWLWCELRDGVDSPCRRKTPGCVPPLSALRKDDKVTVSGKALEFKVNKDDGQPFIELVLYSIVPWRHMAEAEQLPAVH